MRVDDLARQVAFWSAALGYTAGIERDDFVLLRPPDGVGSEPVARPGPFPGAGPATVHLDLYSEDQSGEVARLLELGATEIHWDMRPPDADYVILADPEGNRFCVIDVAG